MKKFVILLFLFSTQGFSQTTVPTPVSAARPAWQDWQETLRHKVGFKFGNVLARSEAFNLSSSVDAIPEWLNTFAELEAFNKITREIRQYKNPNAKNYLRQAPWLYPIDGCYAKAAHVSAVLQERGQVAPGKIFAFGNLRVKSKYAAGGYAYWSYHVVSGYRFDNKIYVFDPVASENEDGTNSGLLTLQEWLTRISTDRSQVRVSICDSNAYDPASQCIGGENHGKFLGHMPTILDWEYNNLLDMGFAANSLLNN